MKAVITLLAGCLLASCAAETGPAHFWRNPANGCLYSVNDYGAKQRADANVNCPAVIL